MTALNSLERIKVGYEYTESIEDFKALTERIRKLKYKKTVAKHKKLATI